MKKRKPVFIVPQLESLEARQSPAASPWFTDSFDTTPAGTLSSSWAQWQNTGGPVFAASAARSVSPSQSLSASAAVAWTSARTWVNQAQGANVEVSATVFTDNAIPVQLLARGSNLNTSGGSFYALSVKTGLEIKLQRVQGDTVTNLAVLQSRNYLSNQWVRATFNVSATTLRAQIFRTDTNQYLNDTGGWQAAPAWAMTVNDSVLTTGGFVGLARPMSYAGTWYVDDFRVNSIAGDQTPPTVNLTAPTAPLNGIAAIQPVVTDDVGVNRVEFYLDGALKTTDTAAPYVWNFDTSTAVNGAHVLTVLAYDIAGNVGSKTVALQTSNPSSLTDPSIPAHYAHIRIAQLAYSTSQLTSFEDTLLQQSVDLVVTQGGAISQHVHDVAPNTPQLLYTNISTLYQQMLTDWLTYADAHSFSREDAFYHVNAATAFTGNSPSSQPVNWFWGVYRGSTQLTDLTAQAHGTTTPFAFGALGESVYLGYTEQFREINFNLARVGAFGWSAVVEYASAVDAQGRPTQWTRLTTLTDTTAGLTHLGAGQITFDPPAGWKPASVNGSAQLYYIRFRTVTSGQAPTATSILGRDYVNAHGTETGVIPTFDYAADRNHDGYLDNTEYAARAAGKDARFAYESRSFFSTYGQMRFATNPSNAHFRSWVVDFERRLLQGTPNATGLFVDNSNSAPVLPSTNVAESLTNYGQDYATLLNQVAQAIGPTKWVMPNTYSDAIIQQTSGYFEELALKPLAHTYEQFESVAAKVATWSALRSPAPYGVLDVSSQNGSPTDARTQMAGLAYYYLLADPTRTFIDLFGGNEPGTSWTRHWVEALEFNVGLPSGTWSLFASGADPANAALTYRVYQRSYTNALVLYKPLSAGGGAAGTLADNTATVHQLNGNYRLLRPDGSLSDVVTSVTLRNGEGAILIKA
jgi:hypothetical protein